jgi:1-phosphofructokinase family hexose kinase
MVLVMCSNAGVDRTYDLDGFAAGAFHRPAACHISAGGKGLNVARALAGLEVDTVVTGFAGGFSGDYIFCDLERPHLFAEFSQIRDESRTTMAFRDLRTNAVTRVDEWGASVTETEIELLYERWEELLDFACLSVVSGNPPPSVPAAFCRRLVTSSQSRGVPVLVDAHEAYLREALLAGPDVITPNLAELSWLAEHPLSMPADVVDYSRELVARGVGTVMTTLGPEGAIVVTSGERPFQVVPPSIDVLSEVGAGDCALAGWIAAECRGLDLRERARWAVATGSACCLEPTASTVSPDAVTFLLSSTEIVDL